MKNLAVRLAPLALAMLQFGCTQAPPPAPPDTRAADEKTIRDMETAWVKEFNAKDMDKIVAHYADDATIVLANAPTMVGKDAFRAGMKDFLADPKFALDLRTVKVEVSKAGDLAYSQGTYSVTATDPKTKKIMSEKGGYVEVYKKQPDGSWKIVEDINTPEAPAAPTK
ncbi:MAG: ketosteroid isomerase-like protein [Bryobacterales bacterium]|nr:ketosteroid isomerase-like protein [Bryobacterales bacterium]